MMRHSIAIGATVCRQAAESLRQVTQSAADCEGTPERRALARSTYVSRFEPAAGPPPWCWAVTFLGAEAGRTRLRIQRAVPADAAWRTMFRSSPCPEEARSAWEWPLPPRPAGLAQESGRSAPRSPVRSGWTRIEPLAGAWLLWPLVPAQPARRVRFLSSPMWNGARSPAAAWPPPSSGQRPPRQRGSRVQVQRLPPVRRSGPL
jgi:hypothetical protein